MFGLHLVSFWWVSQLCCHANLEHILVLSFSKSKILCTNHFGFMFLIIIIHFTMISKFQLFSCKIFQLFSTFFFFVCDYVFSSSFAFLSTTYVYFLQMFFELQVLFVLLLEFFYIHNEVLEASFGHAFNPHSSSLKFISYFSCVMKQRQILFLNF